MSEFRANCPTLLAAVLDTGEEIVLTRHGQPVARVTPFRRHPTGTLAGMAADIIHLSASGEPMAWPEELARSLTEITPGVWECECGQETIRRQTRMEYRSDSCDIAYECLFDAYTDHLDKECSIVWRSHVQSRPRGQSCDGCGLRNPQCVCANLDDPDLRWEAAEQWREHRERAPEGLGLDEMRWD